MKMTSVVLLVFAMVIAIMTTHSIFTGVVTWRNGSIAATKAEQPAMFWAIILLQIIAFVSIVLFALF